MSELFDDKESMPAKEREGALFARLVKTIEVAKSQSDHYAKLFAGIKPAIASCRENLVQFPITRKFNVPEKQQASPPFGGLNSVGIGQMARVFQSPGPLYEAQTTDNDFWRMGQAFHAAGFRRGDLVHNTLSYHLSPGGFIMDGGARACGCAVFPAGVGNTEVQLEVIHHLKPIGYAGTPDYLLTLLEQYEERYGQPSSIEKAMVSGGAVTKQLQQAFDQKGVRVSQAYASAELGLIAYQAENDSGLVVAEDIIVEVVDPDGNPVAEGQVGEVVVTMLDDKFPLIRYATGDLSAFIPVNKSSQRTNMRLKGWLGRADMAVKVKGVFVYPHQIQEVCHRHDVKGSLKIEREGHSDKITFCCQEGSASMIDIQETLKSVTKLKGDVQFVPDMFQSEQPLIDDLREH
ncbi:phenylacetate--CoA ligase family protein [Vibrio sp. HN007]|uniref:phenylacetate--CoA ligase family protein n=1 Tax=Vibrio iocasae TaxID=3098914 RepID=UPI0035D3F543